MKTNRIGQIAKLTRYPVKSMAGVEANEAVLDWNGLIGDRRFGVRRVDEAGDFPWLTASRMPGLLLYRPTDFDSELLPTRVQTPSGKTLDIRGNELRSELGTQAGCNVELMVLKSGIFDDSPVSVITSATSSLVCNEAEVATDSRRFRANIEVACDNSLPFAEDDWVGHIIAFGESSDAPAVFVTKRDVRCKMIGLDPDTAQTNPNIVKTAVRLNDNNAGVYGTVIRTGTIRRGDSIFLLDGSALD